MASRDTRVGAGASVKASKEEARFDEVYKSKRHIAIACSQKILRAQPSSPFSPRALLGRLLFFQEIFPQGGRANPCISQLQIFRNRIRSILSLFSP